MNCRHGRKCVKSEELRLQCEWADCNQIFNDLSDFYSHLESHFQRCCHSENFQNKDGSFSCQWNECVFVTNFHNDLLRHLYFHGYHTKVKWWGLLCYKKQNLAECRTLHNRNIVPELPDGFRCEWTDCYMVFDIPDQFYMHVYNHASFAEEEKINANIRGFKCHWEGCTYHYASKNADKAKVGKFKLREHLRTHTKERSYACPWCGNLYVNRTKFTDHLHRQMCIESHCFQCTHCSRTFATERLLKDHMRHHVNYYKCPKCAMTCPNPSGLKHHMKYKHSDDRPFTCQFCDYKSKTAYDLQVHLSFHQSDLSYRCHVKDCDYAVRSLQNLRYHFRTKHMVGKGKCYACHLCAKTYGVGYQLTNHLRTAHGFQWPPGHSRFKYKECDDGFFRLQTFRFESVELTEELMADDQPTTSRIESSSRGARQPLKPKISKGKKRRLRSKGQQTSTITTRSASLLLQKAQSQRLNFRSNSRFRNVMKLNKKRVPVVKGTPETGAASLVNLQGERNHIDQTTEKLNFPTITWNGSSDISNQPDDDRLQTEFGGKEKLRADSIKLVPTTPQADAIPVINSELHSTASPNQDSNHLSIDAAISTDRPVITYTESLSSSEQSRLAAMPDGSLLSDEDGQIRSLVIEGEKYFLVKGTDQSRMITYSLVSAASCEQMTAAPT